MKILFLCKKFPYPLRDGESIAVSNLCRELTSRGCEIHLLCLNTSKHYFNPQALPDDYDFFTAIHTIDVDNTLSPWKAMASFMSGESYHVRRFRSKAFEEKLIEVLKADRFDIIQLETLYLAPYVPTIRKHSSARVVMRAHNVEHEIWERITQNSNSNLRKLYLRYLTRKLKEYEIGQFPVYDYLVTLTDRDLKLFREKGYANGASSAPIGMSMERYAIQPSTYGPNMSLCFIGSLDWIPNLEGLEWFLANCWPRIVDQWPGLSFHIAGRNTPGSLLELRMRNVMVHGEVEDAGEFLQQHSIVIVPLFSGSGMRVKIIEGMLMRKVVISTSLGMEGIEGVHREDLLIANTVDEFIQAIKYCVEHPDKAYAIGGTAQAHASAQFDSGTVANQMMDIYQQLLAYPSGKAVAVANN
jgi:glycosyltransferase involved in cell wall biosynthesis